MKRNLLNCQLTGELPRSMCSHAISHHQHVAELSQDARPMPTIRHDCPGCSDASCQHVLPRRLRTKRSMDWGCFTGSFVKIGRFSRLCGLTHPCVAQVYTRLHVITRRSLNRRDKDMKNYSIATLTFKESVDKSIAIINRRSAADCSDPRQAHGPHFP